MQKSMSHFTDMARQQTTASALGEVVAAVPVAQLPTGTDMALGAGAGVISLPFPWLAGLLPLASQLIHRWRSKGGTAQQQLGNRPLLLVFRPKHLEVIELQRRGRKLGRILVTQPLAGASYRREGMAIDTRLTVGEDEWPIHGWFERDLRTALGPLGVELERLT